MKETSVSFQKAAESVRPATEGTAQRIQQTIKRNIYRWHRIIGIITIIPIICWTVSGSMHPFMAHWFKPAIPREFIMPTPLPKDKIILSLQDILAKNNIRSFRNFRIVMVKDVPYYQLKNEVYNLDYYSAIDGTRLPDGDRHYAESLARYFLADSVSKIAWMEKITEFTPQYRYVNRLLPVWKVSFERGENMDVYIDTEQTRLGTFNNNQRKAFLWIFGNFHNWEWLANITNNWLRITIMIVLLIVIISSAISGVVVYGFFWKRFSKPAVENRTSYLRRHHRKIGIAVSFVTLTFAVSGAYHVSMKYTPDDRQEYMHQPVLLSNEVTTSSLALPVNWERVSNIALAKIGKEVFYQVFYTRTDDEPSAIIYLNASTGKQLPDGNIVYARQLAKKFFLASLTSNPPACCEVMESYQEANAPAMPAFQQAAFLTAFNREYGFVNKRLPVVKLDYNTPQHLSYYIEPATGRLAARIEDSDRNEGYTFAVFHKYLFMDWAGKNVRDGVMLFAALGVLTVSVLGLILFVRTAR